jgi:hypothetical protein
VVYSHKTQEKTADQALRLLSRIKVVQIVLSAITTGGLIVVIFGDPTTSRATAVVSAIIATLLLALNAYVKDVDYGTISQQHKDAADKLWNIRESYLSLLTDIRAASIPIEEMRMERDKLQAALADVYVNSPRTTSSGYKEAQKGLKQQEELTFTDDEIDKFLPMPLRKGKSDSNKA